VRQKPRSSDLKREKGRTACVVVGSYECEQPQENAACDATMHRRCLPPPGHSPHNSQSTPFKSTYATGNTRRTWNGTPVEVAAPADAHAKVPRLWRSVPLSPMASVGSASYRRHVQERLEEESEGRGRQRSLGTHSGGRRGQQRDALVDACANRAAVLLRVRGGA